MKREICFTAPAVPPNDIDDIFVIDFERLPESTDPPSFDPLQERLVFDSACATLKVCGELENVCNDCV